MPTSHLFSVNKKGFTLVELLVVMTIIAILSVIGLAMYEGAQSQARDAKRRQEIDAIAAALEQRYNSSTFSYPTALDDKWFQGGGIPIPPDPDEIYTGLDDIGPSYIICANLENKNGNSSNPEGTDASGDDASYYCRENSR